MRLRASQRRCSASLCPERCCVCLNIRRIGCFVHIPEFCLQGCVLGCRYSYLRLAGKKGTGAYVGAGASGCDEPAMRLEECDHRRGQRNVPGDAVVRLAQGNCQRNDQSPACCGSCKRGLDKPAPCAIIPVTMPVTLPGTLPKRYRIHPPS